MPLFNFEYQFAITGIKQMISVGEWYDYVKVYVEIIDLVLNITLCVYTHLL